MILFSDDSTYHDISLLGESLDEATSTALQKCKNNGVTVEVPQGCRMPGERGCTRKALLHFRSFFTNTEIVTISNSMGDYTNLNSLSKFFAKNSLLKKHGLMVKGPSKWFTGEDTKITDFLLSDESRPVGLVIATIEDVNGYRTHNIAIDCKHRLLFDPDKFYDNKTWPLTRETLEELHIKKIHSARQIYRQPPKTKGAQLPLYRRKLTKLNN